VAQLGLVLDQQDPLGAALEERSFADIIKNVI